MKKEKSTTGGWKKFIPFPFGNNKTGKEKKAETTKAPKQKIDSKKVLKLTADALQKNFIIADCLTVLKRFLLLRPLRTSYYK